MGTYTERDAIETIVALILLLAVKGSLHRRSNLKSQLDELIYEWCVEVRNKHVIFGGKPAMMSSQNELTIVNSTEFPDAEIVMDECDEFHVQFL